MRVSSVAFVSVVVSMLALGCNTPEEKALARERVDLVRSEYQIVQNNKDCGKLSLALSAFEKQEKARIDTFNAKWKALPESKRTSLMKPHREETNPYYKALIAPLITCGVHFPVA